MTNISINKANENYNCSHQRSTSLWRSYFFSDIYILQEAWGFRQSKPSRKYCLETAKQIVTKVSKICPQLRT